MRCALFSCVYVFVSAPIDRRTDWCEQKEDAVHKWQTKQSVGIFYICPITLPENLVFLGECFEINMTPTCIAVNGGGMVTQRTKWKEREAESAYTKLHKTDK